MATDNDTLEVNFDEIDRLKAEDKAKNAPKADKSPKSDDGGRSPPPIVVTTSDDEPEKPEKPVLSTEDGLAKLKKQLDDSEAARLNAERQAREAAEGERQARTEKQASDIDVVASAISNLTQANDALEAKYAETLAASDFAGAAKVQREMASNAAKLLHFEDAKAKLERAPKPVTRAPVDQVEEYVGRIPASFPRSREWIRAHPEWVRDDHKNQQMIAAHNLALARGFKADSNEYFGDIEKTLAIEKPPERTNGDARHTEVDLDATTEAAKAVSERSPPAAAPVSRSGNGTGTKPNRVRLTAAEVEMAENMQMTPEEYARNKIELQRLGKMN
jgi:hypothetical protein